MDAGALIAERFPELAGAPIEPVGDGWTYDTYAVHGGWIVQIPRNAYASERLRAQARLLPELAHEVSARIPVPELLSLEEEPPVMGYRKIDGVACTAVVDGMWPERLGRFLYDLHAVPPEFVGMRATTVAALRDRHRERCEALASVVIPHLEDGDRADATAMLARYLDDDELWTFAPCLTHNDLGPEHVLVDERGDLVGVLDWEEADLGDPAWDFAWWIHEMPDVGERALAAYGGAPDRGFRERARFTHAISPWHEIDHGLRTGQDAFVRSGREGAHARIVRAP
jgi:aminoglycoside phosphotransferase (APT) family kinase protein